MRAVLIALMLFGCASTSTKPGIGDAALDAHVGCGLSTGFPGDDACVPASPEEVLLHYGPSDYSDPTQIAAFTIEPSEENLKSFVIVSPVDVDINVVGYRVSERPGLHHLDVYTTSAPLIPVPATTSIGFAQYLFTAQTLREAQTFGDGAPEYDGAALLLPATTKHFSFLAHSINTSNVPELSESWITLETVSVPRVRLSSLAWLGGVGMAIPPHTTQLVASMETVPHAMTIVGLRGHTHAHTTVETVTAGGEEVYRNAEWDSPPWQWFTSETKPLVLKSGAAFDWSCNIENTLTTTIKYGNQVYTGEMCNIVGLIVGPIAWSGQGQ